MPYVTREDLITRRIAGDFISQKFPLPTSSLPNSTLSGGYVNEEWTTPPYRSRGLGQGFFEDPVGWASRNPVMAGAIALAGVLLVSNLGGARRRRR
jgi:hypothetical protein